MNKAPLALAVLSFCMLGCGRPPSAGGPPDDFKVAAVLAPAAPQTVTDTIRVVGSLRAQNAIEVVSEINAPVAEILFNEGEPVTAGSVLVRLDASKIQARFAEAEARFKLAETNRKRSEELLANATISQQEYDQVQAEFSVAEAVLHLLKEELSDAEIIAPFDGVTGARTVSPGQFVAAGHAVTRLVQMDPLEAEFRLPERALASLQTGQAIIMTSASTDMNITGEIFFIDPVVDVNSRTVLVKANVPNPAGNLRPGMYGNLEVVLAERENALVIPESAIRYRGDQANVVVAAGESNDALQAEFRNVTVGERMPGFVEITEGLQAGELVVVEGFQKMGPGTGIMVSPASEKYGVTP